jgi:hypothetical protein
MGMKGKTAQLKGIKVKTNLRGGPAGFDLMMIAEYDSIKDFNEYIIHPIHGEVGKFMVSLCEQTASVLYEE